MCIIHIAYPSFLQMTFRSTSFFEFDNKNHFNNKHQPNDCTFRLFWSSHSECQDAEQFCNEGFGVVVIFAKCIHFSTRRFHTYCMSSFGMMSDRRTMLKPKRRLDKVGYFSLKYGICCLCSLFVYGQWAHVSTCRHCLQMNAFEDF